MQCSLEAKGILKKKQCDDCKMCQDCSEARCRLCRKIKCQNTKRRLSFDEQIKLYNLINKETKNNGTNF